MPNKNVKLPSKEEVCAAVFTQDMSRIELAIPLSPLYRWRYVASEVFLKGDWDVINFALTIAYKIDSKNLNHTRLGIDGCHPSEILVRRGEFGILEKLVVEHGLKLYGRRWDSRLRFNVRFNHILTALKVGDSLLVEQAAKFMLSKWCWKEMQREDGATPIHLVLSYGRVDLLNILLAARAPVNQRGWCDLTPLQFALDLKCSEDIMVLLVKNGAEI